MVIKCNLYYKEVPIAILTEHNKTGAFIYNKDIYKENIERDLKWIQDKVNEFEPGNFNIEEFIKEYTGDYHFEDLIYFN